MRDIEDKIENAFFKLLEKNSIEEIDVNKISSALNFKRQTFYYHYKNIYDLIASIISKKEIEQASSYEEAIHNLIDFLFLDKDFYQELLGSTAKDILEDKVSSYLFKFLNNQITDRDLLLDEKKDISRMVSSGISSSLLFLFLNRDYSKEELEHKSLVIYNSKYFAMYLEAYKNNRLK